MFENVGNQNQLLIGLACACQFIFAYPLVNDDIANLVIGMAEGITVLPCAAIDINFRRTQDIPFWRKIGGVAAGHINRDNLLVNNNFKRIPAVIVARLITTT